MFTYISNSAHYKEVLSRVQSVKHLLWIGTADIKDLYVEVGKEKKPFLALIAQLIRRGVEVRLIHAKEPVDATNFSSFEGLEALDICDSKIQNVNAFNELKKLQALCLDGSKLDSKYKRTDIKFSHEDEFFLIG